MPNVDVEGKRNDISETLPELQDAEARLYAYATGTLGIDYRIADFGAFRTEADTTEIKGYRQNDYNEAVKANPAIAHIPINTWRPISSYGSSWHNYGAAFDVLILDAGRYASSSAALQALKQAAPSFGLRSNVPNDPPHFELPISIDEARNKWLDYVNSDSGSDDGVRIHFTETDNAALITVAVLGAILFAMRYLRR